MVDKAYFDDVLHRRLSPIRLRKSIYTLSRIRHIPRFHGPFRYEFHAHGGLEYSRPDRGLGDVHHIFPKEYLKSNGFAEKGMYNQVANYVYIDTQVNKSIGKDAPIDYFGRVSNQCNGGDMVLGNISDRNVLESNLCANCIPLDVVMMDSSDYPSFLEERRRLMSFAMRDYYRSL